ncbi:MAG TPA: Glu/Leu/Phe/Val dehydrogenase dimerization domain-containing protein [Actinomycetota bacterium]|nr:Glu/Leu/Phe/Val dehydrogenase dimerization domain-containing protein [Actinomycetota bacterium]
MDVFELLAGEYETVNYAHDPESGLRCIIAVYSTALGPALGGTRFYPFPSEEAALRDVLRLARAMAFKASAAELDLGGGKAVVIGDPRTDKTPELLQAYGRAVERLGGAYITTADVGTTSADMDVIATATRFVTGTSSRSGDPSRVTAYGVWHGMKAVAQELWGDPSLAGKHVAVQGLGKVGSGVARHLASEGAQLTIADVDLDRVRDLASELGGAEVVAADEILGVPCDILAPCALGAVVNDASLPALKTRAIAGAANNQLERPEHGDALTEAGILYAPDYVINAGGLINVEDELHGYDEQRALAKAAAIGDRLRNVFARARADGISTAAAADRIAGDRIRAGR